MDRYKNTAVNPKSDVFIISQALAENQLRRSGVNFFNKEDGVLGNTGKNLEKFLNRFNRTVYPYQVIRLPNGIVIPKCKSGYISVYNTEISQCYPGKEGKGKRDRLPDDQEITTCLERRFLIREIEFVEPTLLFLMGKASRDSFFKYILNLHHPPLLSNHISDIVQTGRFPKFTLNNRSMCVLPIQHASGANPEFPKMASNEKLIELIREVLK
ncbi:MAG: uracil-DNA glycosylase family protein [Thermoplasmatales archaeon]|nr:MAG: uracil-DNA glycosylase family protein [Thermoplasmatales archaeon]